MSTQQSRKRRNFPKHSLESALRLPQAIQDQMGGQPMNRLLLAEALSLSPSSSNYRDLLSSAYKYGLSEGTEKAEAIYLTDVGRRATSQGEEGDRARALREAAMAPEVFGRLFRQFANKKLPSAEMLPKILVSEFEVPDSLANECADLIAANGRFVTIVRDIGGSAHVLIESEPAIEASDEEGSESEGSPVGAPQDVQDDELPPLAPPGEVASTPKDAASGPKPIFIGHGRNKAPLEQLKSLLVTFQIPHKVVVEEANLGRPIPKKVKETIEACGSAILIFTKDEKLKDAEGQEIWRPSENVIHELGATSFAYGDRIVIFKEKGLDFPTNFQSIGYIEFEAGDLAARAADLLKELIGFGLVKVTPTQ